MRSNTPNAYDEHSVELLMQVATHLTPAIQNALDHQQSIRLSEERERSLLLDVQNQELQRLNEAKSQFLSTVSHELKTPLTSISAFTDILLKNRQGGMTERDLSQLAVVQRNNRRLGSLIDDLLDLSRLDRDSMELTRTSFDVTALIKEVVEGFQPIADTKAQSVFLTLTRRPVWLLADKDRLVQVITNLLSNASKYSSESGVIKIATRRWKDRVYFSVSDNGIGISEEDQESLFTLFFRADNENTRSEPGTGIGLYIARSIVEMHGGKIGVKSSGSGGTTVNFYIPAASSTAPSGHASADSTNIVPWSRLDQVPDEQIDPPGFSADEVG
ncbi:MAG: HAMP domain-containing histidine kinase [Chloroflexi bacterium]|nr:HAMP domain-containing histidine kinase [Chloroflexota bacterium]MBT4072412.1 HAMP domain-containing histidine kinase [Chloroflexota bacterium]MBT5319153.1 HAMP domain-containing histidine kinase [Chloroflexota bacterium]MBT6682664.1 HAMP domain-containing histidine kinase [Chloroflexota bacterium]